MKYKVVITWENKRYNGESYFKDSEKCFDKSQDVLKYLDNVLNKYSVVDWKVYKENELIDSCYLSATENRLIYY